MQLMDLVQLRKIMQEQCQLEPDLPILVGVSGGPDSLCLLDVLYLMGYPVIAAHVDHQLRPTSQDDAAFVRDFSAEHQIPFTTTSLDVALHARTNHLSIEEAARKLRYAFLCQQAQQFNAQAVAVAHTADDQVETVLMHLLRGAGLGGLKGMVYRSPGSEWDPELPIVRPLLATWRTQVMNYCRERYLQPRLDETNLEPTYHRNRLRLELIPILEGYNPRVKQVLWRMAQSLAGDYTVVEEALRQAQQRCNQHNHTHHVTFDLKPFISLPTGQQRSLLRNAIGRLLPNLRDIDFHAIERALTFVKNPTATQRMDLVKNLYLFIEEDRLFIAHWGVPILDDDWPWMAVEEEVILPIPGEAYLGGNWVLKANYLTPYDPGTLLQTSIANNQCWLDAEQLHSPLIVRPSRPGERIQPLGMEGHSLRLSDYWVNKKLPRRARATWPLVWCGEQIAWAPDYQPGHAFRITASTKRVVQLELIQVEADYNVNLELDS